MNNRLKDKVIIVTGGTKGIGKGIAYMAAEEGARVVISGRSEQDGRTVTEEIGSRYGVEALFVAGDITREEACKNLIGQAVEQFGRVDGLVNNAGIFPRGAVVNTSEEMYDAIFSVNMKAAFFCCKYAITEMMRTGGGSIVNMGSTHGYGGGAELAAYAFSKGAMLTLSRHVAAHYGQHQIRSNWVTVGWVATEGELELFGKQGKTHEDLKQIALTSVPTGRMQTPEDIAAGVVYLLSDDASQVTGSELAITGGLGLRR